MPRKFNLARERLSLACVRPAIFASALSARWAKIHVDIQLFLVISRPQSFSGLRAASGTYDEACVAHATGLTESFQMTSIMQPASTANNVNGI